MAAKFHIEHKIEPFQSVTQNTTHVSARCTNDGTGSKLLFTGWVAWSIKDADPQVSWAAPASVLRLRLRGKGLFNGLPYSPCKSYMLRVTNLNVESCVYVCLYMSVNYGPHRIPDHPWKEGPPTLRSSSRFLPCWLREYFLALWGARVRGTP